MRAKLLIRAGCYNAKKVMAGNKYNARKVYLDGFTFDSAKEAKHYIYLKHRQRAGEIFSLEVHPPAFDLIVNGVKVGSVKLDFAYRENAQLILDDAKGFKPRDWSLRSKLFMALHRDIELRVNGIAAKKPKPYPAAGRPSSSITRSAAA